jgi:predicted outer membrane repeat protein
MHLKLLRVAGSTALCGGIMTLGLLPGQAALADPNPTVVNVPCSTSSLVSDMTSPTPNTALNLAGGCTYWLTTGPLPTVMHELTINGHGAWIKRSSAVDTPSFSIFVVGCTTGDLILKDVNVANGGGSGEIDGGAVDVTNGSASIHGGTFRGNTATYGGAIANYGTLTVVGATFTDNNAQYGGAIYSEGTIKSATLDHDTFSHNYASALGGAVDNNDNDMTVTDSLFRDNSASNEGGAVYNEYDLTIKHSRFGMNSATWGGGVYNEATVAVERSVITTNQATDGGGGVYNENGAVNVTLAGDVINSNAPDQCEPLNTMAGCTG